MKNLALFLVLLFISICVYLTPNEYYEFMFGLFASASLALSAVYGYSRKVNPILKSLNARIRELERKGRK